MTNTGDREGRRMSDTISRQAAIDALESAFDRETILNRFVRKIAISAVRKLPSADRPQGWVDKAISIIDAMQKKGIIDYEQAWEFRMRARMKGADDE